MFAGLPPGGKVPEPSAAAGTVRPPRDSCLRPSDPGSPDSVRPDATGAATRRRVDARRPTVRGHAVRRPRAAPPAPPRPAEGGSGAGLRVGLVAKLRAVLRVRDFRRLWMSMSLSSFGDWLGLLAITATATSLVDGFAAANFALGGVLLFRLLPAIVLGPLAGAFADRFDRRKTMVVVDVIRFGLFASIPLVDNLIWLFVAQFLIEAFSAVLDPGQGGRRPEHAPQGPAGAGQPALPGDDVRAHARSSRRSSSRS